MKLLILLACLQDPREAMERSIARQLESVGAQSQSLEKQRQSTEKQRASARKQTGAESAAATHPFFTVQWTKPLIVPESAPVVSQPQCDPVPPEQIGAMVAEISQREGLTPDLLRAVIEKESAYLPCAVSSKGAQGLMQLMPATAAELGVEDAFDPHANIEGGAKYLKQLLLRYAGSLPMALAAYNAGPGRVNAAHGLPLIPETVDYVNEIVSKLPIQ